MVERKQACGYREDLSNRATFRIYAATAVAVGLLAFPTLARGETIRDALERAFLANPLLNAQRASLAATSTNLPRAAAGYFPKVNASTDIGYSKELSRLSADTRTTLATTPRGSEIQIEQNLFDGFRTTNSVHQAQAQINGGRAMLRGMEQSTLLAAVTAYMDVLSDRVVLKFVRANIDALARQMEQTRERHSLQDVTRADVAQVATRLAGAEAEASLAEANVTASIATSVRIVGSEPSTLARPASVKRVIPLSLKEAVAVATRDNPAIQAAAEGVKVSTLRPR